MHAYMVSMYRKPPTSEELAEIHRAQQAAEDADVTTNGAPLADSSEEEEGEADPEAEEESEDTRTSHPKPLLKHELLRKGGSTSGGLGSKDGQNVNS